MAVTGAALLVLGRASPTTTVRDWAKWVKGMRSSTRAILRQASLISVTRATPEEAGGRHRHLAQRGGELAQCAWPSHDSEQSPAYGFRSIRMVPRTNQHGLPAALEHLGLYVALQAGGVRETWDLSHRVMRPRLLGDPCQLSVGLQLVAYRAHRCRFAVDDRESGQISIRVRCGRRRTPRHPDDGRTADLATAAVTVNRHRHGRALGWPHDCLCGTVQCHRNRIRMAMVGQVTPPPSALHRSALWLRDHLRAKLADPDLIAGVRQRAGPTISPLPRSASAAAQDIPTPLRTSTSLRCFNRPDDLAATTITHQRKSLPL